jgi:Protein of unknown function (DUF3833)
METPGYKNFLNPQKTNNMNGISVLAKFKKIVLGALSLVLVSCSSVTPEVYKTEKPVLVLENYFNGIVDGWGMFQDRSGQVVKRFTVVMRCSWVGDTGVLDEDFTYSDGTKEKRVWNIKRLPEGRYIGTAGDVVGQANGQAQGNALQWQYTLALKVGESTYNVSMNDWMYLMDEKVMFNRTAMSKFGVHLGDVTLAFTKR